MLLLTRFQGRMGTLRDPGDVTKRNRHSENPIRYTTLPEATTAYFISVREESFGGL